MPTEHRQTKDNINNMCWYLFHEQLQNECRQSREQAEEYIKTANSNESRAWNFE